MCAPGARPLSQRDVAGVLEMYASRAGTRRPGCLNHDANQSG
jgi:hypothetical protein